MKIKRYITLPVEGGGWKFGVPSIWRPDGHRGRWAWTWALSLRTYSSKDSAARAARRYRASHPYVIHNNGRVSQ